MKYDWDKMSFSLGAAKEDYLFGAFIWKETPQGHEWWSENANKPEGRAALAEMISAYEAEHTAPVAAEDGWISWYGGKCPVAGNDKIEVKMRNGFKDIAQAFSWRWSHNNWPGDIIAYRIVNPQPTAATTTYLMVIGNECWPFTSKEAVTEAAAKCKDALVYEVGKPLRVKIVATLE